ncbi:DNA-directed DNA polymerase alpha catalytic subunit pol1 [Friedmanniomyces endolithicus]|nr:DNA-directed DNA polymerase alpha catalytic subunit pol1 [Friedmanniomyces endolithicus]KAK0273222.1 DNA-directed DNA polymerase alpha catalytic subunit pol1 [Friedmanniomyces endolithicus]KAK0904963.1 DNA-directed DNA polymerase alpha catalytic subunit pol1 [Friedmanniomyces endolithicus]KAK0977043.1 DNA-directed DNA polymerase alpha catalytic subunit pol1 [Friedmanniomyces endolithicus]KAK1001290.1 DNA-directed DNA polymerase alpha catalytic subunit pol1 [Friedmanniomyces endolithicus]
MAPSRADRLAQIRALRAAGKTAFDTYEVAEAESIYETVDDEGYKKVVRSRLDQDDFVVDDNGEGYADDGREDWQDQRVVDEDSESEGDLPQQRGKVAKRKREEDTERQEKLSRGINKYFNANQPNAASKPKPVRTAADDAFMNDLLGEVDTNIPSRLPSYGRPVKSNDRRKTRVLSPPIESRVRSTRHEPTENVATTPPVVAEDDDDAYFPQNDNVPMSDPLPSSPIAKAVERKEQGVVKTEVLDDDDLMEIAEVQGHTTVKATSVNIKGSRPAPKVAKAYPTPDSSSPTRALDDGVDMTAINNVTERLNILSSPAPEVAAAGKLGAKDALENDGTLRFFWTDYTEVNGSLCLFGKVKNRTDNSYVSCFVKVDNVLRKLYFLPREHRQRHGRETMEEVEMGNVYEEVDALMTKFKVNMHKIKPCSRKYAFELPEVPKEADYLKLLYPYDNPALPMDISGETFARAFGTNTALFEQFVLWKNIMGPCWLKIDGANFQAVNNASWCKLELQVDRPNDITTLGESDNLEAPPLTLMSLALRTTMSVKENKNEILVASVRFYPNISLSDTSPPEKLPSRTFTFMRPNGGEYPVGFKLEAQKHKGQIMMERNEGALLSKLLAVIQMHDPDALVGHRLDDVDYNVLLTRMRERKTPGWHRIGRMKRGEWPKNVGKGGGSFFAERHIAAGRLLCDLANDMGKSIMTACQSWTLDEMVKLYLGGNHVRKDIDNEKALAMAASREGLLNYVKMCELDTYYIAAIALKQQLLPLSRVLTNLAGNSWARTLSGTRAERNEYILLHEFHRNKYICPDKVYGKGASNKKLEDSAEGADDAEAGAGEGGSKKKDKFKGGLVFEPEKGLYDKFILVMDFNSLYPSIIQEYNICFTTVERAEIGEDDNTVPDVPGDTANKGILPRLIRTLVSRRREVKKLMKTKGITDEERQTWDVKQLALKLTANSMYGCLGYTKSRFYARPLAALTTSKGREILQSTKELAESAHALRVIYGDTDSVMVNTNQDNILEAIKMGNEFKKAVNERYELLEIEIDNVFRRLLLHAKKKYAAVNMIEVDGVWKEKMEVKGLDMRRREYCQLSKDTSTELLNFLLSGEDPEKVVAQIHDHLRALAEKMRSHSVPAFKYTIYTQLGKAPKEYPNAGSMPSVQVALKLLAKGKPVKAKDVMAFVICGSSSGSAEKAANNAHAIDEVLAKDSGLVPDIDYYLHKQILPPVERLCAPISGTNVAMLAECLGLDTSKYRVSGASQVAERSDVISTLESQVPDHIRFKECEALGLLCLGCRRRFEFRGLSYQAPDADPDASEGAPIGALTNEGLACPREGCRKKMGTLTLSCQLEAQIRRHTSRYYEAFLVCDDPACGTRTRQMSVYGRRCLGPKGLAIGCSGRMAWEYSEKGLYNQLLYLRGLFDVDQGLEKMGKPRVAGVKVEESEKVKVLAGMNRERFGVAEEVVKGYLDRSAWGWVSMEGLFGFARKG